MNWWLGLGADPHEWIPAHVPGAVQLDWARAHCWPEWWKGDNWRQYAGLEDRVWTYETLLPPREGATVLHFKGVDYAYRVTLDGDVVYEHEGMFAPADINLTGRLDRPRVLRVTLLPAPKDPTVPGSNWEPRRSCKPAVSYGWDFHPRLIPLGIWDDVTVGPPPWRVSATYRLSDDLSCAFVSFHGEADEWHVISPNGRTSFRTAKSTAVIPNPELWWPHDHGKPARYTVEAARRGETQSFKLGMRRTRLVMHEGAWEYPPSMPKTRSNPPITLEINGRRIFAKGSNWVSPDVFPGSLNADRYREQLDLVKSANMNLLRMWGGAVVQKDAFYEICDELGIMVWQEFPLACNLYPDDPAYLEVLDRESRAIVNRLKAHPSVVLWCGGNELFNSWSGMTDQSHALRLLNANCFELDRMTPFLPTSPVAGMGHGGYTFRDPWSNEECWAMFQCSAHTAYTEFGCAGIASVATLRSFLPEEVEFPPARNTVWQDHCAFESWSEHSWLNLPSIEHYFGPSQSLGELVAKGQLLQAEGLRGMFEEARRQKPTCSMALNWCLNEPWPTAANNSLIEWPCNPKPALKAVGEACRPALASARISKFLWIEGELFDPELWILNDSWKALAPGTAVASVGEVEVFRWAFPEVGPNANLRGPKLSYLLPAIDSGTLIFAIRVEGRPELDTVYTLAYHRQP